MKESLYVVWLVVVYSMTAIKNGFVTVGLGVKKRFGKIIKKLECEDCNFIFNIITLTIFTYIVMCTNMMGFIPYLICCVLIVLVFMRILGRFSGFYIMVLGLGMLIGLLLFILTIALDAEKFDSVGVVEYDQEKIFKNNNQDDVMTVDINGKLMDLKIPKECRYTSLEFIVASHQQSVNVRPDLQDYVLLCNNEKVQAVIDEKKAKRVVKMEPLKTDK